MTMEEINNNEAVKDTAENKAAEESKATAEITETDNKVPEGNEGAKETKDTDVIKDTEKNRTDEENSTADATPKTPAKETKITKKSSPLPIILAAVAVVVVAAIIGSVVLVQSFSPEKKSERQCISAAKFLGDLDFEQAVAAYKTAIEIDPNNEAAVQGLYDAYMAWAKSLEDEGNDAEAVKRYEDAIAANPAITDAYYALADIYIRTNNTDALLKLYEKASASLAGEDTVAFKTYLLSKLNDRITELLAAGDTDSALLFLAAIEKIDIDSAADVRENILNELLASGTEEGYRKALDIDPESESAYLKLIDYYLEKEDYEKAGKTLNEGEDAVDSATITAKRSEIPYVIANNIKVETEWKKSVSYDAYPFQVVDYNGYRLDSPEIKVDKGVCTFNIDSITEESTADGMKTITINTSSSIQPKFNVTRDGNFDWSFRYTLPGIGFYDYYSGKFFNSRDM
ncbi:MAG: tetratricopeptide repeat protein, partial [Lachnospiraceae bacterium]|nr:tetratricopeptide repeat protein [Lachnospiraceae bacterium]